MPYTIPISAYPLLQDPPFVVALLWIAAAIGRRLTLALGGVSESADRVERAVLFTALGAGALQFLFFGLGAVGLARPWAVWSALVLLVLLFIRDLIAVGRGVIAAVVARVRSPKPERWFTLASGVMVALLAVKLLYAVSPVTDADGQWQHLNAVKRWLQASSLGYLPTLTQSQWPMGVQMLMALGVAVWSDTAGKLIHYGLGLFALLAIFALGRRLSSAFAGLAAAFLFLCFGLYQFGWAYVDLGVSMQVVAAVLAWFGWRRTSHAGWLHCSALCAGFAASFKLTTIFLGFILAAVTVLELRGLGRARRAIARAAAVFMALSLLPVVPWLVRAWLLTGNPVYPNLSGLFSTRDWTPEAQAGLAGYMRYFNWSKRLALSIEQRQLVRAFFLALIAVTAGLAVWRWRDRQARVLVIVVGSLLFASVWLTGPYLRYLLPSASLLFVTVLIPVAPWFESSARLRGAAAALMLLYAGHALWGMRSDRSLSRAAGVATGAVTRDAYLDAEIGNIGIWRYVNTALAPDARILLVRVTNCYYSDRYCFFTRPWIQGRIRMARWEEYLADLRRDGIRYVVVPALSDSASAAPWDYLAVSLGNEMAFARRLVKEYGSPLVSAGQDSLYVLDRAW